jgi:hypothetical protein
MRICRSPSVCNSVRSEGVWSLSSSVDYSQKNLLKVMERCVYKHIYNFLLENRIISSNQSGFTPGDSAINQLLYITNEFGKHLTTERKLE